MPNSIFTFCHFDAAKCGQKTILASASKLTVTSSLSLSKNDVCSYEILPHRENYFNYKTKIQLVQLTNAEAILMFGTSLDKIQGEAKIKAGKSKTLPTGTIGYFIIRPTDVNPTVAISVQAIPVIGSTFVFIIIAYAIFGFMLVFCLCAICFSRSLTLGQITPVFEKIETLEYKKVPLDDFNQPLDEQKERFPSYPGQNDATVDDPSGPLMGVKEKPVNPFPPKRS